MLLIGITGLAGSGKSTVAEYLRRRFGFEHLTLSDILIEEAIRRGLLNDRFNKNSEEVKLILSKLGNELRRKSGKNEIVALKMVEKIKKLNLERVCVDGFRSPEEVKVFKETFDNFFLILVDASKEIRFKRRKKLDPNLDLKELEEREKLDLENKGLKKVLDMADFKLDNNGSLEELYSQIEKLMNKLLEKT
ncbi:MAG TPA: hypothetical protein ENF38_01775 [Candidatus Aenigmarchaeota archaeon]|nr:hypothetical protein [Candidatus Aenigmarchaeota archaeon]